MEMSSLNNACLCYMYLIRAAEMAKEVSASNRAIADDAISCAERMRIHICKQFEKPEAVEWPAILLDAGLTPGRRNVSEADRNSKAFRDSCEKILDPAGVEILEQMQMHKDQLVNSAFECLD